MSYIPVLIIGAGRSGTNMLRDIITSIPSFDTWDCDEINPIWRYGNRNHATDELKKEQVTPKIKDYIQSRFHKIHRKSNSKYVVEKTCANSLRLEYLYAIFPNAKYIIINRDGRDVVPSAMKRWTSSFELSYTLKKLRYVPLVDLHFYVFKFGFNRLKRIFGKSKSLSFWGPLYNGISEDKENLTLMKLCANQWKSSAEAILDQRKIIPQDQVYDVKYEDFVSNPVEELKKLTVFLGVKIPDEDLTSLTKNVSSKSVGSHKKSFSQNEIDDLEKLITPTLKKLRYE